MRSIAEELANEIIEQRYVPDKIVGCQIGLPNDRNPQSRRFIQPLLISAAPTANDKHHLEYLAAVPMDRGNQRAFNRFVASLARAVIALKEQQGIKFDSSQVPAQLINSLIPLQRAGLLSLEALAVENRKIEEILTDVFSQILQPDPPQPIDSPQPHIALCAIFDQTWQHKGYTRGELISNIGLAPGEQLTLEFHSWDKSTVKREQELAVESEIKASENLTDRDSLTVVREMARQRGMSFNAGISALIPDTPISVNAGGDFSENISNTTTSTSERISERTVETSNTLKSSRKLRIEVSREVGREEKQTRVLANTNRCHTLNCLYFEVLSNYLVTTRFAEILPCLLLPNPRFVVNPAWVLCHEDALKQALLSKIYLPGFEAARILETQRLLPDTSPPDTGDDDGGGISIDLADFIIDDILKDYTRLIDDTRWINEAESAFWQTRIPEPDYTTDLGGLDLATFVVVAVGLDRFSRVLSLAQLHANQTAVQALTNLSAGRGQVPSDQLLSAFYGSVRLSDFYSVSPNAAALATGLGDLGISNVLADGLLSWGFLDLIPNDAGLARTVQSGLTSIAAAAGRSVMGLTASATALDVEGEETLDEGFSPMRLARAGVDFEQLKCHIEDNWLHYFQAVWFRENPAQRFMRLQQQAPFAVTHIRNEVIGFVGDKSAYPLLDLEFLEKIIPDFRARLEAARESIAEFEPAPRLVTMPTQGSVLEAMVGECDACEEFIRQSRVLDLRSQEAKARQEEAEAKRWEMRLELDPPDLSDPRCEIVTPQQ